MSILKLIKMRCGGESETLKERRKSNGMTQEEVAAMLDVDQTAVSNWERGINPPLPKYQRGLAKLYGCTVDELLKED